MGMEYDAWLRFIVTLKAAGEEYRAVAHAWSSERDSARYVKEELDKKWDALVPRSPPTLAVVFDAAREAGWSIAEFGKAAREQSRYELWRVYETNSTTPKYKKFRDPISQQREKKIRMDIASFWAEVEPMNP